MGSIPGRSHRVLAPLQLDTLLLHPCLVLMRAECPEGGLLSPSASFLLVFTTAEGAFLMQPCPSLSVFWVGTRAQSAPFGRICSPVAWVPQLP